jgi:hypothetical protein
VLVCAGAGCLLAAWRSGDKAGWYGVGVGVAVSRGCVIGWRGVTVVVGWVEFGMA